MVVGVGFGSEVGFAGGWKAMMGFGRGGVRARGWGAWLGRRVFSSAVVIKRRG